MTILTCDSLSYTTGARVIIENISFSINEGDRLGIVGVNGSGKTTLLSMITGELSPSGGDVFIARDKRVGLLAQDDVFALDPDCAPDVISQMYGAFPALVSAELELAELQVRLEGDSSSPEYERVLRRFDSVNKLYTEGGGLYYKARCASVLSKLGFDESFHALPVSALSGGQRTRLALVRLILSEPDILMLDEPTNHLDIESLQWLEVFLSTYKKTVLVVSHDRYFLDRVTNKTLEIENKRAKLYNAAYSGYFEQKRRDREAALKRYELQQREIKRQLDFIEQQRRWGQERNFVTIRSREKYLEHMKLEEKPDSLPKTIHFQLKASGRSGNDVLSVRELSMAFQTALGKNELFDSLSFEVKRQDRLFIVGANGCGKSTLIKLLTGSLEACSGVIEYGYNVEIGYYDQENQNLNDKNTVIEELWGEYPSLSQNEVRSALARFLFIGDDIEKPVAVLSGGERARLTFCKLILSRVNLLILDEPTNHLDIASREVLEDVLDEFDGTLIAVSHDRYFIKRLATRILPLKRTDSSVWEGGYEDYIGHISGEADGGAAQASSKSASNAKTDSGKAEPGNKERYQNAKREAAELRKRRREYERVTSEIERAEGELVAVEEELFGDAAVDYVRASELDDKRVELENLIYDLIARQEQLEAELEKSDVQGDIQSDASGDIQSDIQSDEGDRT